MLSTVFTTLRSATLCWCTTNALAVSLVGSVSNAPWEVTTKKLLRSVSPGTDIPTWSSIAMKSVSVPPGTMESIAHTEPFHVPVVGAFA